MHENALCMSLFLVSNSVSPYADKPEFSVTKKKEK